MTTTRAVVRVDGGPPEIREVPVPRPDEDEVLVRVRAVGLAGAAAGPCGYAGTVEAVGSRVTKELRKGDRVAGVARGAADGVDLAEYVAAKGDLQMAIPDGLGDEEAAALGGPLSAVCQAYAALQLPLPPTSWFAPQSILIHGGATPVGRLGIQFARRSGLTVLATRGGRSGSSSSSSSSRRRRGAGEEDDDDDDDDEAAAALRALGAAAVFDAAAPACAAEIRARTRDRLTLAWDCTGGGGDDDGAALCAAALSATEPGVYYATPSTGSGGGGGGGGFDLAAVNPRAAPPRAMPAGVAAAAARVYYRATTTRDGADADADPADAEDAYELARGFWACAQALLESGDLAAPAAAAGALEVNHGGPGLEGVLRSLEALRARREGGEEEEKEGGPQLVYTL